MPDRPVVYALKNGVKAIIRHKKKKLTPNQYVKYLEKLVYELLDDMGYWIEIQFKLKEMIEHYSLDAEKFKGKKVNKERKGIYDEIKMKFDQLNEYNRPKT
jgi:hypothetical protein